jgi:hypothetical protein
MLPARSILLPLAAAAIIAVTGCGSGKEQVSAAELVQKADRICRVEQTKFDRIQAHPPANAFIAADQTRELIEVAEAASSDLGELKPPEPLTSSFDRYLDARDRAVDEMRRGRDAAENQDSAGYAAAQTAVAKGAPQRRRLAGALGLRVCGSNPRSG